MATDPADGASGHSDAGERPRSDESKDLIERAGRGDAGAVELLLQKHLAGLRVFVRLRMGRLVRSKESSEDLVQSVCREALQDLDGFEYRGEASFRHWLFRRAERKVIDRGRFYRRLRRDAAREVAPVDREDDAELLLHGMQHLFTPSRDAVAHEELERLEAAFAKLPDDYREVIVLSRIVGLSHEEIGERMQRSRSATWTLLSRALARLGTLLENE